jgi:hypothetical protein
VNIILTPLDTRPMRVHLPPMRVRIDREREERKIATGWFARTRIPAYCLSLTIHFTEEERYLIRHTGIGRYAFFQAPIPPDVTDPDEIKKLKAADYGLFLTRDLLGFSAKTLLAIWPDLIAADEGESAARAKLEELAERLARAGGTTESSVVYEL